ncbi:protoglobin domain-containing protein [Desulfonatronovibrio magnus]|uniref:protoglobin domain-containing protein n=1 Tax=Desulfonatronovibrio magnus TaxID=698827 RepID=UPI0005EB8740|nr:protoglobin domain-containing protein [Desulfonatronovibrio magnus]
MVIPAPIERLKFFKGQLGIDEQDFIFMRQGGRYFIKEKDHFAQWFFDYFIQQPHTKAVLEHETQSDQLKNIWAFWFESLFKTNGGDDFFVRHWKSGLKHVQIGIDHRYINMAYGLVRRFVHEIARREVDSQTVDQMIISIDKVLDLCILIETDAFITTITQCDHEVIKGIAHQVRNPLTVIGGNIMRLQKKVAQDDPRREIYSTMLSEAKRLEIMVKNVVTYNEIFQKQPVPVLCNVQEVIEARLQELESSMQSISVEISFDGQQPQVLADEFDFKVLCLHVLQNGIEASLESSNPVLRISTLLNPKNPGYLEIRIFNNGPAPSRETLEQMFTPFYSTKAMGTGFGLPIVKLAARKNHGNFTLEVVEGQGVASVISMPLP